MSAYIARVSKSSARHISVTVHAKGCACVTRRRGTWPLVAATLPEALDEVRDTEDADVRGIRVKAAPCAKAAA